MSTLATSIVIGDQNWFWPAIGLLALVAVVVAAVYVRGAWPLRLRWGAGLLKAAGFAILVACLTEPLWSGVRAKPGENLFVVLVDDSASLQIRSPGAGRTRAEQVRELLRDDPAGWQVRLEQDFEVRRYRFDARMAAAEGFANLAADGPASSLRSSLSTLAARFRDRSIAGVLLISDGNATDWSRDALADWNGLAPVYPVLLDDEDAPPDIAIENVAVNQTAFEDAPVTVQADVRVQGLKTRKIVGQVVGQDGSVVQELRQDVLPGGLPTPLRFQIRPEQPGLNFYIVRVAAADDVAAFDDPAKSPEGTLQNNSQRLVVDRGAEKFRVLYVGGRANWEFKFLRRAIQDDTQVELVGLVRVALKEAKFDFRGRAGESSNPLFRGFKERPDEETEAYDQPVIVRLGTRDDAELRDGFPKTKSALFEYHAVILDDVEAAFFTHDQMTLIEKFVAERGGGLLMLGGPGAYRAGGYARTPIGNLLPVYLDAPDEGLPERLRLHLTRDGWLQPWMRLRNNESDEEQRLAAMPAFQVLTRSRQIKPAARLLATVQGGRGESYPAFAAQQFGRGRVGAVLIGDLWRWSLQKEAGAEDDLAKAWRQTVRWLIADVPERVSATAEATASGAARAVQIRTLVRTAEFEPLDNAAVKVTIHAPGASPLTLDAEPSLTEPGVFEATYVPHAAGGYRAEVVATDAAGAPAGRAAAGWTSDPASAEFRSIGLNRDLLRDVAAQTGGETVDADDLPDFVTSLPTRRAPVMQAWTSPMWQSPWILLLAIGCLGGEWGLRRLKGMP